ncbi:hypothetical protein BG015_010060 [Linnemannia schmuckeri]|uniref:Uncharacterized protein n=1 Tax=Linnemannia schmuckeri TaxID=64567 RepID=A0A9P5V949_9FUNG|nr:hypothetical protein BG015_010060 [Linnemannia schmuckeri]
MAEPLYKPDWEESVSLFISLSCISIMALLFGRKTAGTKWGTINYARGLVIALYMISWGFSFMATILVQTNNNNIVSCVMSIYTCIALYAGSKVVIYLFLMEKVYVVTAVGSTRRDFFLYKVNLALLIPYSVVISLMIAYQNSELRTEEGGKCYIGLGPQAAYPLILYDIFVSCWLTFLFIRPLMSSTSLLQGPSKGKLRDVARRTLLGCVISLILSTGNISSLVIFKGYERGLICLSSCTADVTLNAITIHWVTSRGGGRVVGTARSTRERPGTGYNANNNGVHSGYHLTAAEKQVAPLESHMSITVESYVEEYHQMHYGGGSSSTTVTSPRYGNTGRDLYGDDILPATTRYGETNTSRYGESSSSRYGEPRSSRYGELSSPL